MFPVININNKLSIEHIIKSIDQKYIIVYHMFILMSYIIDYKYLIINNAYIMLTVYLD